MIEMENIQKEYVAGSVKTQVLKGVSFRVQAGEFVAIMGASGTGKSTLMNILGLLDKPTGGHYRLDGKDVVDLDDDALSHLRNHKIGFVFQQFHLLARTTALRNVMLPLIYADEYPNDALERAEKALMSVGLSDRMDYRPSQLSGGEQQRVAIARALITNPAIILADEPTGNLDSKSGAGVISVFQRLHREGRTIILITHNKVVAEHANRIVVLSDGAVVEDRSVAQPRNAATETPTLTGKESGQ